MCTHNGNWTGRLSCIVNNIADDEFASQRTKALFYNPIRRLIIRSREVSKPRDWQFKLSDRFEIWQAHRQRCCRCACQISKLLDKSKYKSRGFETSRDLMIRRLIGYWNGAQNTAAMALIHFPISPGTFQSQHQKDLIQSLTFNAYKSEFLRKTLRHWRFLCCFCLFWFHF